MENNILVLKAKICGFENTSKRLNRKAAKRSGMARWKIQHQQKYCLGSWTRSYLIAYALLRGRSYRSIENKCEKTNRPNIEEILRIIHDHVGPFHVKEWTRERIEGLLKDEERCPA